MGPSESAERYREYAGKCIALAHSQNEHSERLWLLDMAQCWIDLALKNERLQTVYATPEG